LIRVEPEEIAMPRRLSPTKVLLGSLIAALSLSALIGIYIFVAGDFGEMEIKTLITTLSLSFFSITSLGCTVAMERQRVVWLTVPGLVVSGVAFFWSLLLIWAEWHSEPSAKGMVILVLFAFSFAQGSLLELPRLRGRAAWTFPATLTCIAGLALLLSGMIVFELDDEFFFRLAGVLGILDASGTLSIPILHRLGRKTHADEPSGSGALPRQSWQVQLACPRCGHQGVYPAGLIECPQCALGFRLTVLESPPRAETKRFQFSLRAILVLFLVVALPLGWIGFRLRERAAQAAAVAVLEESGARVHGSFGNAEIVTFYSNDQFDSASLAELNKLPRLHTLRLRGVPVADEDLRHLEHLELTTLELEGTGITDGGLGSLSTLGRLRVLDLEDTGITDAGLNSLATLPSLRVVKLKGTSVTEQGMQRLRRAIPGLLVQSVPTGTS
jgi:hypothetical protein